MANERGERKETTGGRRTDYRPSVDMGLCENAVVNLDVVPEKELSCWEDISLGSVESIWIDPFPIQPELNQSSSDIEELGFLPPWDASRHSCDGG